jgi:hypothetical protein
MSKTKKKFVPTEEDKEAAGRIMEVSKSDDYDDKDEEEISDEDEDATA